MKVLRRVWRVAGYRIARLCFGRAAAARCLGVRIGSGCRIISDAWGTEPWLISIGDHVTVASGVTFLTHDGGLWLVSDERGRRHRYGPIRVGSHVFIGFGAIILPNVTIEDRVVIGAGTVVTRSVPSNSVVVGNPGRIVGTFDDYERHGLTQLPAEADIPAGSFRHRVMRLLRDEPRVFLQPPDNGSV